jgi:hypothetical protein
MARDPIATLLQLGAVAAIALGAILLLLRLSTRTTSSGIARGYPAGLFPRQDLVRSGPLAALAAIQARLLAIYEQTPRQSDLAVWLQLFLGELRAVMDTAYHVAVISSAYGPHPLLDRLVANIQAIEAEVAEHAIQLVLAGGGDAEQEWLSARLATLRMCAGELAQAAESRTLALP